MAETVRGGILSIDIGQTEGAKAIGMTHFQTMTYVMLPQALRNIMPQIGNNFIINIKDTSVMFIIGLAEFSRPSRTPARITGYRGHVHRWIYLFCTLTCSSFLLRWWEKKLDGPTSYDLVPPRTRWPTPAA
jgi:ABC-type amino acid transport system permease subunit